MSANKEAWEVAYDNLNQYVSTKVLSKPVVGEKDVKFFKSKYGQIALETPRKKRSVKGAKFWLSFKPNVPANIEIEKKEVGAGRNNKLNNTKGSLLGERYPVWSILIEQKNLNKNLLIEQILNAITGEAFDNKHTDNEGEVDVGNPQDLPIDIKNSNSRTSTEDDEFEEALGYQADPEKRRCIELYAEDWAVEYYKRLGFTVEKKGKPYDLLCTKGDLIVHVEAKGTMGLANKVILTRNEVTDARNGKWRSDLFVVRGIVLVKVEGNWQASGGEEILFEKWAPLDQDLIPITYEYNVSKEQ